MPVVDLLPSCGPEAKKQAFLYEAARHLMLLQPCGNEGEEVYVQVWEAVRRRELARAYIKTDVGYNDAQATDEGGFATFRVISYWAIESIA